MKVIEPANLLAARPSKIALMMSQGNLAFICATCAGVILLFTVGLSRPGLFVEDGILENLGAGGFAAASLLALAMLLGGFAGTVTDRSLLIGTSGLSLLLFFSEISFGARIFQLQMPQMSGGGEFDGGHDIVIVLFRRLRNATPTDQLAAAAGMALLLACAAALLLQFRRRVRATVSHLLARPFEFRLTIAVGMLASAVSLDLMTSHKASILEETLEFSASVVLILALSALFRGGPVVSSGQKDAADAGVFGQRAAGRSPYPRR